MAWKEHCFSVVKTRNTFNQFLYSQNHVIVLKIGKFAPELCVNKWFLAVKEISHVRTRTSLQWVSLVIKILDFKETVCESGFNWTSPCFKLLKNIL